MLANFKFRYDLSALYAYKLSLPVICTLFLQVACKMAMNSTHKVTVYENLSFLLPGRQFYHFLRSPVAQLQEHKRHYKYHKKIAPLAWASILFEIDNLAFGTASFFHYLVVCTMCTDRRYKLTDHLHDSILEPRYNTICKKMFGNIKGLGNCGFKYLR